MLFRSYVLTEGENNLPDVIDLSSLQKQGIKSAQAAVSEEKKKKILEQRVKLAPTAHQIQMDEQRKLMEARKRNMLSGQLATKS